MAKLTFSHLFLLVLVVSAVSMVAEVHARIFCSVELDPNKCDIAACQSECIQKYKGAGECAHFGWQIFHCVCTYICL